jgi:hypothetical protein
VTYLNTLITGSPFNPTILNNVNGKHKEISKKIFIFKFLKIKFIKIKTIIYHIILKKAVE